MHAPGRITAAEFWVTTVLGLLAILLFTVNLVFLAANGEKQARLAELNAQLTQNSQRIQRAAQLATLTQQIAQATAQVAAQTDDQPLLRLLAENGFQVQARQPQGTAPAGAPTEPAPAPTQGAGR